MRSVFPSVDCQEVTEEPLVLTFTSDLNQELRLELTFPGACERVFVQYSIRHAKSVIQVFIVKVVHSKKIVERLKGMIILMYWYSC